MIKTGEDKKNNFYINILKKFHSLLNSNETERLSNSKNVRAKNENYVKKDVTKAKKAPVIKFCIYKYRKI